MKNLFLIFVVQFLLIACVANEVAISPVAQEKQESAEIKEYRGQIKKCDEEAADKSKNPEYQTTIGISVASHEHTECYKSIATESSISAIPRMPKI